MYIYVTLIFTILLVVTTLFAWRSDFKGYNYKPLIRALLLCMGVSHLMKFLVLKDAFGIVFGVILTLTMLYLTALDGRHNKTETP